MRPIIVLFLVLLIVKFNFSQCYAKNTESTITMDGEIRDGEIWNGRHYIYDELGLLDHIEFYKEGEYVGNGVIGFSMKEKKDTINQKDKKGNKIGYWRITTELRKRYKEQGYSDSSIIEEGVYKLNRKVGIWKKYWPNGNLNTEIEYKNGRASNRYISYYQNGNIEEKRINSGYGGKDEIWRYYKSGCLSRYSITGMHIQNSIVYYNDDCNASVSEKGTIDYLHKRESPYVTYPSQQTGGIDREHYKQEKIKLIYCDTCKPTKTKILVNKKHPITPIPKQDSINGYHKTYNAEKDILLDGEFKNGHLYNGKYYIYDEFGLLDHIEVYKEGKYVGNGVLFD